MKRLSETERLYAPYLGRRGLGDTSILKVSGPGAVQPVWLRQYFEFVFSSLPVGADRSRFADRFREDVEKVESFETIECWICIQRIVAAETGLIPLLQQARPGGQNAIALLSDLVCDLHQLDLDGAFVKSLSLKIVQIEKRLPAVVGLAMGGYARAPKKFAIATLSLASGLELRSGGQLEGRVASQIARELILATQYGLLQRNERRAVRRMAIDEAGRFSEDGAEG